MGVHSLCFEKFCGFPGAPDFSMKTAGQSIVKGKGLRF
jgi:hypothetical protein